MNYWLRETIITLKTAKWQLGSLLAVIIEKGAAKWSNRQQTERV
jgi:hypothetical protein